MSQTEELLFDLEPVEIPVTIGGKKYILREADEGAACKWRNALLKSAKLGPEGKPASIEGMADSEPLLVSLCLWEQHGQNERRVPLHVVNSWPSRIVKKLFNEAKRISELDEAPDQPDKGKEKNLPNDGQNPTSDTSDSPTDTASLSPM